VSFPKRSSLSIFWRKGGWIAPLVILAGIGTFVYTLPLYEKGQLLANDGLNVLGEITYRGSYTSGSGSKSSTTYRVRYSFTTPDDPYARGEQKISKDFDFALIGQDEVTVRYAASDPKVSEIELGRTATMAFRGFALSIFLILAGALGGALATKKAFAMVNLRKNGDIRKANVTSHSATEKSKKAGHAIWLDEAGHEGASLKANHANLPAVGSKITIFVDPAGKLQSLWEGDIGSR